MLKIYDTNHNAIGHIVKYKDLMIESDAATGEKTLSFTYLARYHEICEEYYIEDQDDEYVIKEKSVSTDGFLQFVAALNLEELEAKPWSSFSITDSTIEDAAKLALAGSGWTVGECTVTKKRNAGILQTNTLGVIQKLCTVFMCDVSYDTKNKKVSFYEQIGQDKGTFFLTGLNLRRLQRRGSSYDYYTRIIPIGQNGLTIESVNDGKNYLENYQYTKKIKTYIWKDESYTDATALKEDAEAKLQDLSKPIVSFGAEIIDFAKQKAGYKDFSFSLGDTITLIDAATGIREKQRIIKITQYPQNHTKDECELANKLPSFEETREKLQAAQEIINTVISDDGRYTGTINVSDILHFNEGQEGGWRDGQCDFVLSTTLTKYWVTYTIPKGGDSTRNIIIPRIGPSVGVNGSGIITIQWEKLEEGNKATDWTPAPEDVDAAVDAANNTANAANSTAGSALSTANSANSTANSASSKADAASGMAVDAKNVADSADASIANWCYNNDRTYINGGRLYAGTVTATQLAADSVTADKIGAAAVTSEKIAALSVTADKIDVADLFAQNITATGTISGLTLTSADVVAKRIIATKEISLSCKNTADVERVLYYDGTSVRVGKLLNAAGAQSGAGFEFFDKTITMYGSLNLYSGDITIPGKVQGKTITATVDMNTNTIYASNWFRSRGTTGWYSEDYGGGWYMTDADWIRAYNGKGITTNGNMSIGGYIQGNNIIKTTYEYQSNRGSVDWRFGAATGTGDENFFGFYDANNRIIPLAIDGNFGNIYVGFNVGGSGSKTAVGIYLGAQVAGNRAFIYHGDSYAGSIWIQTRLDGSWKWFSLGRVCSTALSDIRLKGNIRDTEVENATKVIESMKIRSFERKDSHKKYKIGFIADELEQLDPNLVDGGGEVDGHPYYKFVNNLQMLAYVVKSMQELNQRVSELEKENEKLKRKLNLN